MQYYCGCMIDLRLPASKKDISELVMPAVHVTSSHSSGLERGLECREKTRPKLTVINHRHHHSLSCDPLYPCWFHIQVMTWHATHLSSVQLHTEMITTRLNFILVQHACITHQ